MFNRMKNNLFLDVTACSSNQTMRFLAANSSVSWQFNRTDANMDRLCDIMLSSSTTMKRDFSPSEIVQYTYRSVRVCVCVFQDIKGQMWTDEDSDGENEPEQFLYGIQVRHFLK